MLNNIFPHESLHLQYLLYFILRYFLMIIWAVRLNWVGEDKKGGQLALEQLGNSFA